MEVLGNGNFGDWSSSRVNGRRGSVKKDIVHNSSQVLLVVNGAVAGGVGGIERVSYRLGMSACMWTQ